MNIVFICNNLKHEIPFIKLQKKNYISTYFATVHIIQILQMELEVLIIKIKNNNIKNIKIIITMYNG